MKEELKPTLPLDFHSWVLRNIQFLKVNWCSIFCRMTIHHNLFKIRMMDASCLSEITIVLLHYQNFLVWVVNYVVTGACSWVFDQCDSIDLTSRSVLLSKFNVWSLHLNILNNFIFEFVIFQVKPSDTMENDTGTWSSHAFVPLTPSQGWVLGHLLPACTHKPLLSSTPSRGLGCRDRVS